MTRSIAAALVVVGGCAVALLGGACSGHDAAAGVPGLGNAGASGAAACERAPVPREQFAQQIADTFCDGVGPCCVSANLPYGGVSCKSSVLVATSQSLDLGPPLDRAYDPAGAARCLCAIEQELAVCQDLDGLIDAVCQEIYVGTLPPGSPCRVDHDDCAPPGYCKMDWDDIDASTCADDGGSNWPRAGIGEPCVGSCYVRYGGLEFACAAVGANPRGNYCYSSDDLYCSSETNVCTRPGQIGQACTLGSCAAGEYCSAAGLCAAQTDSGSCVGENLACTSQSDCIDGQCTRRKAAGEACISSSDCLSRVCIFGETGVCAAEPSAASPTRCAGTSF